MKVKFKEIFFQLILETTDINYYLTVDKDKELIVLKDRHGHLPDWVYTLPCAERLGIIQRDEKGDRIIVGNNRTMNPFTLTRVTSRF